MWCLSVFFVSAATGTKTFYFGTGTYNLCGPLRTKLYLYLFTDNPHLQAIFPYLQQRFGSYTHEDKRLFCLAARHFYYSLGEDQSSKDHFIQTIKNVAQSRTPYYDLLKSIEDH